MGQTHDQDFLSYHLEGKFNTHHLLFRNSKNREIMAVLPGAVENEVYLSPFGASYGGIVLSSKDKYNRLEVVDGIISSFVDHAQRNNIKKIKFTLPPLIYFKRPHNYIDFVLINNRFQYYRRELTCVLPLKDFSEPFELFNESARRCTRKVIKSGIVFEESRDFDTFYEILEKNQMEKHGSKPTHTKEELFWLVTNMEKRLKMFMAYKEKIPIAGIMLFLCNDAVALAFYIANLLEYQRLNSLNGLFFETFNWCKRNDYLYLDLGTGTKEEEVYWGVLNFKESLGARGFYRDTFIWEKTAESNNKPLLSTLWS